jgi:hypothetical protein
MAPMKRAPTDIPPGARERLARAYRQDGGLMWLRTVECIYRGKVVGRRYYDEAGRLLIETPLRNGAKHGREIHWRPEGGVELIEPYVDGQHHGTARQYDRRGRLIGTYRMRHGTGYDVWRCEREAGPAYISEIHQLRAGIPHGIEWWLREDGSLSHERTWHNGRWHGIEREWNPAGRLRRSYPRYWVNHQRVDRRRYLRAATQDPTLPPYNPDDNFPWRQLPPGIT